MRVAILLLWGALLFAQTSQDTIAGAKTFRSHCAACHGLNGEGGRGPNLARGEFYHGSTDDELLATISNGIPGTEMPGLFYSSDRIRQIIAYLRSLRAVPGAAPGGNRAAGERVYRAQGCATCHRIDGVGGWLGPDLSAAGSLRSTAYLRESILEPSADVPQRYRVARLRHRDGSSQNGFVMGEDTYAIQLLDLSGLLRSVPKANLEDRIAEEVSRMPSYKNKLSATELEDLVAYLSTLRSRRGAP